MGQISKLRRIHVAMALFLHSRGFSVAILEDALTVISAYNVVLHNYPVSNKDVIEKVKEKISFYLPEVVILEDADGFGFRKGKRVKRAISAIEKYARIHSFSFKIFSK